jgi:predicted RNase H-like HicB family nuclease
MLTDYLTAAVRHAVYELLPEDGEYYGEIPLCPGVFATAKSIEECRSELLSVLEDWIFFRIHRHLSLPVIDGLELTVKEEPVG